MTESEQRAFLEQLRQLPDDVSVSVPVSVLRELVMLAAEVPVMRERMAELYRATLAVESGSMSH